MSLHIIIFHSTESIESQFIKSVIEDASVMKMNDIGTVFLARSDQNAKTIYDKIIKKNKNLKLTVFSSPSLGWASSIKDDKFQSWVTEGLGDDILPVSIP